MLELFGWALGVMAWEFADLEKRVPQPRWQNVHGYRMPRYEERSVEQAMVQKVAHIISGLNAMRLLLEHGHVHEQAGLHRSLDDAVNEVFFFYNGVTKGLAPKHVQQLDAFWEELFDHADPLKATSKNPNLVSSAQIRATNIRAAGFDDTSTMDAAGHAIHKAYSSYLHAASPPIMDLYDMAEGRFRVYGMRGTLRMHEHVSDAANYIFRGFGSVYFLASALGDGAAAARIHAAAGQFAEKAGVEETPI
ncbi:MAG: hypothetical protein AB7O49_06375 [Sphingomonadales bacterium]